MFLQKNKHSKGFCFHFFVSLSQKNQALQSNKLVLSPKILQNHVFCNTLPIGTV